MLWSLWLGFWCLISQFTLIFHGVLGSALFFYGIFLFTFDERVRKAVVYSIVPLGLIAAWNVTGMGGEAIPAYFHTSSTDQIQMMLQSILPPLLVNLVVLNQPQIKNLFSKTVKFW